MSDKVGNISFYDSSGQSDFGFTKPYSEKTAEVIDQEVKQIIEESYLRAQDVLQHNLKGLIELAELLLEKEVIFSEDLERIFGKRKADILKEERESALKQKSPELPVAEAAVPEESGVKKKKESAKESGKEKKASDKASGKINGEKTKSKK
jgi:cell division protease FtsH